MTDKNIKSLAIATIWMAVRDYFDTTPERRRIILKDLRSPWMDLFTNGMSVIVAEQLELHPKEIETRLRKMRGEEI